MNATVRISVPLPFRNAASTVEAAVLSILNQQESSFELLAVDDGSDDDSVARVRSAAAGDPRVQVLCDGQWMGLAARLNQLIEQSRGDLLARMDADDVAHPARLTTQAATLDSDERLDLIGCGMVVLRGTEPLGIRRFPAAHEQIASHPWRGVPLAHPAFMGRAAWFRRHRYSPAFAQAQDQELLLRTCASSRFANVDAPLIGYRMSASVAVARRARRARRRAVRMHLGWTASIAAGLRDTLAFFAPARHASDLIPLSSADRARWQTLAESGRWPAHDSAS